MAKTNTRYFFSTDAEAQKFISLIQKYKGKTVYLYNKEATDLLKTLIVLARHIAPYVKAELASLAHNPYSFSQRERYYRCYVAPLLKLVMWLVSTADKLFPAERDDYLTKNFNHLMKYAIYNSVSFKEAYEINYNDYYGIQDNYREPQFEIEDEGDEDKRVLYLSRIYAEMIRFSLKHFNPKITFPLFSIVDLEAFGEVRVTNNRHQEEKVIKSLGRMRMTEKIAIGVTCLKELEIAKRRFGLRKKETLICRIGDSFAKHPALRRIVRDASMDADDAIKEYLRGEDAFSIRQPNLLIFADTPRFAEYLENCPKTAR